MTNPKTEYSNREKFTDKYGGTNNECYTPEIAIHPLLPFLDKSKTIWDCAYGTGRLAEHFRKQGFKVIGADEDFLGSDWDDESYDIMITNPPYSLKDEFLEKAFKIGKPFVINNLPRLIPSKVVKGNRKANGLQMIIPNRRINFEIPSGKKSAWFPTAWFTWGLNLPKDLNFVELK
jgi:hypothetical protein